MTLEDFEKTCQLPRWMDDKERLLYVINGVSGIKDEETLREAFRRTMEVANAVGMNFSGLRKRATKPIDSVWPIVKVLVSERSVCSKLIVTIGCLMAMAEKNNIKLI
jgi:hypothetical protein